MDVSSPDLGSGNVAALFTVTLFLACATVGAMQKGWFGLVCGVGLAFLTWAKGRQLVDALRAERGERPERE